MTDTKVVDCPWCDRTDDHAHEFYDVLSPECEHEIAKLRAENARLLAELEQMRLRVADLEDSLLDAVSARRSSPVDLAEFCAQADASGAQLTVDPEKMARLQAKIEAERAKFERERADSEHLEQGCAEAFVHLQWLERQRADMALHQVEWLREHERRMAERASKEGT